MPYSRNEDLPDNVRHVLPDHAQSIYREAFNNALKQYGNEEQAFAVAWSAVKKQYEKKSDGKWSKK